MAPNLNHISTLHSGLLHESEEEGHEESRGNRDDVGEAPAEQGVPREEGEGEAEERAEVVDSVGDAALCVVEVVRDEGDGDGTRSRARAKDFGVVISELFPNDDVPIRA